MDDTTHRCARVRELMLEAEPADLRGTGSSHVAVHVRECMQCSVLAERMLSAQQELGASLDALTAHRVRGVSPRPAHERAARASGSVSKRRAVGALMAAAAAVVLILYPARNGVELARPESRSERIAMAADRPVVSVTSGDEVVIMNTTNPDITVVWYMDQESQR